MLQWLLETGSDVDIWHLPPEFFLWKSLTLPGEEVHADGAHDRRGTFAPSWPPCMQEPPTKYFLPSPSPSTGSQSPFGVVVLCKHLFVIQDLSPPLILQTKTTHSSHKNQVTEYLQHDDLTTEGLQMLQKPVFKPRQNSEVVMIKYPWPAGSGWKMVSAVVIVLPEPSLSSCMKWSMVANQGEKLGDSWDTKASPTISGSFLDLKQIKKLSSFQLRQEFSQKQCQKNFPLTSSGCWKQREIMWQEKRSWAITKKINCKCNNIQAFWWNILQYIALKRVALFTDLF